MHQKSDAERLAELEGAMSELLVAHVALKAAYHDTKAALVQVVNDHHSRLLTVEELMLAAADMDQQLATRGYLHA